MPVQKLKSFLDKEGVKYVTIQHSPAYTAQEIAAAAHIRGKQVAKTVMIKRDGEMAMAVLPASDMIEFMLLQGALGTEDVELATEEEFEDFFPGCELGAMPPFGNLYDMDVFVDARLAEDELIAFNAGTFTELIQMPYATFERLVQPIELHFSLESA